MDRHLSRLAMQRPARVLVEREMGNSGGNGRETNGREIDVLTIEFRWRAACLASALVCAVVLLAGCGGDYYQVTDAAGGKTYYTRSIDHDDGSVRFKDQASGDEVILNSSEVREVTPQQYRNAVGD